MWLGDIYFEDKKLNLFLQVQYSPRLEDRRFDLLLEKPEGWTIALKKRPYAAERLARLLQEPFPLTTDKRECYEFAWYKSWATHDCAPALFRRVQRIGKYAQMFMAIADKYPFLMLDSERVRPFTDLSWCKDHIKRAKEKKNA